MRCQSLLKLRCMSHGLFGRFRCRFDNRRLWLCRMTKAIFVSFNADLQLFTQSIITFQFTDGGSIMVRQPGCYPHWAPSLLSTAVHINTDTPGALLQPAS